MQYIACYESEYIKKCNTSNGIKIKILNNYRWIDDISLIDLNFQIFHLIPLNLIILIPNNIKVTYEQYSEYLCLCSERDIQQFLNYWSPCVVSDGDIYYDNLENHIKDGIFNWIHEDELYWN